MKKKRLVIYGFLLILLLVTAVACQPQTVEVTRVVTETIVEEGETVEVTRVVTETETVTETVVETEEVVVTAVPEAAEQVIIGGFDVGPGGDSQGIVYLGGAGHFWYSKIFTPLVMMNSDFTAHTNEGALATEWTPNDDATVWTFKLREGVTWHDGEPFTADDVKFTAEFVHAPGTAAIRPFLFADRENTIVGFPEYVAGEADEIEGIKVVDDNTVEFHLQAPNPRLFDEFRLFWILPEHAIDFAPEDWATTDWFLDRPVGTGPYKFSQLQKDEFMELVPNEAYWDGAPKIERLINRYFVDETAAMLALSSGDIDFTYLSADVATRFQDDPRYQVFSGPSFVTNLFNYNYNREPWNDIRVRQAMMYGIDRQSIIDNVFNGTAIAAPCEDPYPAFWPEDANMYEYDPDKARELLAEAAADGISLEGVEYPISTYYSSQLAQDILLVMQANLADIGIAAVPTVLDVPSWRVLVNENADFDFTYRGRGHGPASYLTDWYTEGNQWGLDDPMYAELFAAMDAAVEWEDYVDARKALCSYQNEQATFAYWWVSTRYGIADAGLQDFHYFPAPGGGPFVDNSHNWVQGE
jgi:peptide/nickel transport system substrate-binding protein